MLKSQDIVILLKILSIMTPVKDNPNEFLSQRRRAFEKVKNVFSWLRISGLYKKCYETVSPGKL